jgi:hypothetical protein
LAGEILREIQNHNRRERTPDVQIEDCDPIKGCSGSSDAEDEGS